MNEFRLPPLVVDYNQLWLEIDLRGDIGAWARRATAELLARQHWSAFRSSRGEKRLASLLGEAAGIARRFQGASMGFFLVPSPQDGIQATVHFSPVDLADREGGEAWDTLIRELAPELPGDYPPEITSIDSKVGECRRLRLRYAAGDGAERPVGEHVCYLWVFDNYGAAVMMTTSFTSMLEAARWLQTLDEFAGDVCLQQSGEVTRSDVPI
jgi:hypothetical protein